MAIAFLDKDKYERALAIAEREKRSVAEVYKELGGAFVEGSNAIIESTKKVAAEFDSKKERTRKVSPKKKGRKKRK